MATRKIHESLLYARDAGANLNAKLNYFAKIDSDGDINICGDGEAIAGVIYEAAKENKPVTIQFGGIGTVRAAGSITAGNIIASDSSGEAVAAAATDWVAGIALNDTSTQGELVSFLMLSGRRHS